MSNIAAITMMYRLPRRVFVHTSFGFGNQVAPAGYTRYTAEIIAGGGQAGTSAGGAGGQYAKSDDRIVIAPGATIYRFIGSQFNNGDSWVNTSNAAPTLSTTGAFAKGGAPAFGTTGGSGSVAGSIGAIIRFGGNGGNVGTDRGGGGAGASSAGSGMTAGTDTTGLSPATPMGGGNGGQAGVSSTLAPGGGAPPPTEGPGMYGRARVVFDPN